MTLARRGKKDAPCGFIMKGRRTTFNDKITEIQQNLERLNESCEQKIRQAVAAIKAQAPADGEPPNDEVRAAVREVSKAKALFGWELRKLRMAAGISGVDLRAYERAEEARLLPSGDAFWLDQVLSSRSTEDLDALTASALDQLLPRVPKEWLLREANKPYRLGESFRNGPLHVVNGVRVGIAPEMEGPQRFARMLLLSQDHLAKQSDYDFFLGASLVPEVAALGNSLDEIAQLGPEADRKLSALPWMPNDQVTATIYELLVGAACVRRGLRPEMVPENKSGKVPDFRLDFGAIPCAIECKRRLGLTNYELEEAHRVQEFYSELRPMLQALGVHSSIEVSFRIPLSSVDPIQFVEDVLEAVVHGQDIDQTPTAWGSLAVQRLVFNDEVTATRLYAPSFLDEAFGWKPMQIEWDGIICEVDPPHGILVHKYRMPLCLKWRSESEEATTKKARGIASQWRSAIQQIPDGEIGFIYIAYPEGARPSIADARTRHILKTMEESWHRWAIRVPVTVVSRLYPRPMGAGCPDLIESALPGSAKGQEHWLTRMPYLVFTRAFENP